FRQGIDLAMTVNARTLFDSHRMATQAFVPGCPDVYIGLPPEDVADLRLGMDAPGVTWADHCAQDEASVFYSGYGYWEGDVRVSGVAGTPEGLTIDGDRMLVADGVMGDADGVVFEFDGEASDAMQNTVATDYSSFRYSSLVDGTSTGSHPFPAGSPTPEGWRADLYVEVTGGDVESIELRGNAYFFTGTLAQRFDSIAVDLSFTGELGAGPDDCTLEPLGWIGLRDPDAVWYDLVFLPRSENDITGQPYPNDPLQQCDGCGTLYIRGVEQGTVCPDFTGVFDLTPPTVDEFVLSVRELPIGGAP
ncbi:MAG: hypothetical protein KC656_24750, partial [Myxococcales bacterium]|nr:hypothetical protein [Myxococcales bacterium]